MSSRFVSGGTISSGEPGAAETSTSKAGTSAAAAAAEPPPSSSRNAEWEAVEKELAAERQRREEQRRKAATGEEKSLFDILQDNKGVFLPFSFSPFHILGYYWTYRVLTFPFLAAKQAAFEEQNRIKNQFRALDDDEIDFLDEVRQKKRKEEERMRRETEQGLKAFREAQKGREKEGVEDGGLDEKTKTKKEEGEGNEEGGGESSWGVGRKRKRVKEREVKGLRRRVSNGGEGDDGSKGGFVKNVEEAKGGNKEDAGSSSNQPTSKPAKPPTLGLVDYGSDSDD